MLSLSTTQGSRVFNTWMGDPPKLLQLEAVIKTIKKENLQATVKEAGDILLKGLEELQVNKSDLQRINTVCANFLVLSGHVKRKW